MLIFVFFPFFYRRSRSLFFPLEQATTTTKWLESAHFGLRRYIAQARPAPKSENSPKLTENSENVGTLPKASGRIPTHPSRSVWVRMDPNALRNLETLPKTCDHLRTLAKIARTFFGNFHASERSWMHPDASEQVRMCPNGSERTPKP